MFAAIFEPDLSAVVSAMRQLAVVVLVALSVKLLDDFLDDEAPEPDRARPVYALLALSVGVVLAPSPAVSLFLAAYVVGMLKDVGRPFPSGLRGWQEMAVVALAGLLFLGWREMGGSLVLMAGVQLGDDLLDWAADRRDGRPSMVGRWGAGECLLALAFVVVVGWCLAPGKTVLVGGVSAGIWWAERTATGARRGAPGAVSPVERGPDNDSVQSG